MAYFFGVSAFSGNIVNSGTGTISAGNTGIAIYYVSTLTGNISNAGTISAKTGINIVGSTITGGIFDSGIITATSGPGISIDSASKLTAATTAILITGSTFTGNISNAGTISAKTGIKIAGSTITGGIFDSGIITAKSGPQFLSGILIDSTSKLTAAATAISITGPTFTGNISNAGTISAKTGINIAGSTITGGIIDTGVINASSVGINIVSGSELTGAPTNIYISGPTFTGGITNAGTLKNGGHGIFVDGSVHSVSTFAGNIVNSAGGTIAANRTGILISDVSTFLGGITNSGTISSNMNYGINITGVSTFTGSIVNNVGGTISGEGIVLGNPVNFQGGITNAGTISGLDLSGVRNAITIVELGGTISATQIFFSDNGDTLTGYGTINVVSIPNYGSYAITLWPTLAGTGVLTINGSYAMISPGGSQGGTLEIEVNPTTASKLAVNGPAALGGTLKLVYDPGTYKSNTLYTILTSTGLSGTFSSVTGGGNNVTGQTIEYSPPGYANDVVLTGVQQTVSTGTGVFSGATNTIISTASSGSDEVFGYLNNYASNQGT